MGAHREFAPWGGTVGVTAKNKQLFVEPVLYRYRASIPWCDLPERFHDFRVGHTRFTAGLRVACGHALSRTWRRVRTMNTPLSTQRSYARISPPFTFRMEKRIAS
jgi:hypothetical protein